MHLSRKAHSAQSPDVATLVRFNSCMEQVKSSHPELSIGDQKTLALDRFVWNKTGRTERTDERRPRPHLLGGFAMKLTLGRLLGLWKRAMNPSLELEAPSNVLALGTSAEEAAGEARKGKGGSTTAQALAPTAESSKGSPCTPCKSDRDSFENTLSAMGTETLGDPLGHRSRWRASKHRRGGSLGPLVTSSQMLASLGCSLLDSANFAGDFSAWSSFAGDFSAWASNARLSDAALGGGPVDRSHAVIDETGSWREASHGGAKPRLPFSGSTSSCGEDPADVLRELPRFRDASSKTLGVQRDVLAALMATPAALVALSSNDGTCDICGHGHPTLRCGFLFDEERCVPLHARERMLQLRLRLEGRDL